MGTTPPIPNPYPKVSDSLQKQTPRFLPRGPAAKEMRRLLLEAKFRNACSPACDKGSIIYVSIV